MACNSAIVALGMELTTVEIELLRAKWRMLREWKSLKQKEAGDLVGLEQTVISEFERGSWPRDDVARGGIIRQVAEWQQEFNRRFAQSHGMKALTSSDGDLFGDSGMSESHLPSMMLDAPEMADRLLRMGREARKVDRRDLEDGAHNLLDEIEGFRSAWRSIQQQFAKLNNEIAAAKAKEPTAAKPIPSKPPTKKRPDKLEF